MLHMDSHLSRLIAPLLFSLMFGWIGCASKDDSDSTNDGGDTPSDPDASPDDESDEQASENDTTDETGPLFPHADGNYWTYLYTEEGAAAGSSCSTGEWTARLTDKTVVDGVETYTYLSACAGNGTQGEVSLQFEGDNVTLIDYDEPYEMLLEPVEDGAAWETAQSTSTFAYVWESVGTVTVTAGTFDHCWKRVDRNNGDYLTYCRGIGRVEGGKEDVVASELIEYHLETE